MRFFASFFLIIFSTASIASITGISLPSVKGKIKNFTGIPSHELSLQITYHGIGCGPEEAPCFTPFKRLYPLNSDGSYTVEAEHFDHKVLMVIARVDFLNEKTKTLLKTDPGMRNDDNPRLHIAKSSSFRQLGLNYYQDFLQEIHLFDWTGLKITLKTPNNQSFEDYVAAVFMAKGHPELLDQSKYEWKIVLERATYTIHAENNKRYWKPGSHHYFESNVQAISTSKLNLNQFRCNTDYHFCFANRSHNQHKDSMTFAMGYDGFSENKILYGLYAAKAYDIVKYYSYTHEITIQVSRKGERTLHKEFQLTKKTGYIGSPPETIAQVSKNMDEIFIKHRVVELLEADKVGITKY